MWENGTNELPCRAGIETRRREWTCGQSGEGEGGPNWERSIDIYTRPGGKESQWGAAVYLRELSSVRCDDLEGWNGGVSDRETHGGGDIHTQIADSLRCTEETNTLRSNYTPIKKNEQKV